MAFSTPSLADVWTRLRNSMRAFLPGTDAWIEPNNLSIAGRSFTLAIGSAYERILYLYAQLFASTADGDHLELRHAFEYGLTRKQPAAAQGFVSFTQTSAPFVTIPANYKFTRSDGYVFSTLAAAVPSGTGLCTVEVRGEATGAVTNTLPGVPLDIAPDADYPNLPTQAIVGAQGLGGGTDVERDEELRARVLQRKRNPAHGGAKSDYERWALEVPGVTRVFVSPFKVTDANQVSTPLSIFPLFDDTRVNGVPTAADLLAVATYIDVLRPVTARVYVVAAMPVAVPIRIGGLQPDTSALRAAIAANLAAMFAERMPVATAENGFTLPVAWIDEAIARAEGYQRHRLVSPADDVSFLGGQLPILGVISYGL
jgi:uncharacterized phage protein gp47/JayE